MTKKRPICFAPGTLDLGGIGRHNVNLANYMTAEGYPVHFFLTKKQGVYLPNLDPAIDIFTGKGRAHNSLRPFLKYVNEQTPCAILTSHLGIDLLGSAVKLLTGIPVKYIPTVHTNLSIERENTGLRKGLLINGVRWAHHFADHVVAVSRGVAEDVLRHGKRLTGKVKVIYNPVFSEAYVKQASLPTGHDWLDKKDIPVILGVGRLTKAKDFVSLIRAFSIVKERFDSRLLILGEGEDRAKLEGLIKDLGLKNKVSLPGYVSNPASFFARANLYVLSSRWEGFGNVLVEAMSVGTPVVATDCPNGPSEILDGGRYGELVPVGDVGQLAEAILRVLANPPSPDVLRQRASEFSVGRAAESYLELILA